MFIHDEELRSLVRVTDGSLNREDYCAACWTEEKAAGAYSQWSLHFYDPKVAEQEPPEVFSPLRRLFYEAAEQEDRIDQAKAFLAAQLLRRQKVFRLVKEADEDEGEARLYLFADRIGNRLIEVRDPRFSYPEMEAGRRRLMERLEQLEHPETGNDNGHDTPTE
ncbi:MAG: hypothetical protein KA184_03530 [Candidatus Hydrogenedentes bacterium]|nr:hypothetical protein [Candidatus Hydrogenedentota bacterium]